MKIDKIKKTATIMVIAILVIPISTILVVGAVSINTIATESAYGMITEKYVENGKFIFILKSGGWYGNFIVDANTYYNHDLNETTTLYNDGYGHWQDHQMDMLGLPWW